MEIRDKTKIHVEITDLVVPEVGDDLEHAKKLCKFVYDEFGPDMPLHFLQFHPSYKMMEFPSTPVATLEKHYEIAKAKLAFLLYTELLALNHTPFLQQFLENLACLLQGEHLCNL